MRTLQIILGGLVLLGLCVFAGRQIGGNNTKALATAALVFLPLWFIAAAINMAIGVTQAGYSVGEELPIFLVIFGLPAVAAAFVWRQLS